MSGPTRWWWIRHAPVPGYAGRLYGQTDLDCDTSDAVRFQALAASLPKGAVWVTSHLCRTHQTAEAICRHGAESGPMLSEPALAEQAFGTWQGMTWDEIRDAHGPAHAEFWTSPGERAPPGGESFLDMVNRVAGVVGRLTAQHAGRDIVAVAHAGSIRAAVAHALGLAPALGLSLQIDNLSLTRLDHHPDRAGPLSAWRVVGLNLVGQ